MKACKKMCNQCPWRNIAPVGYLGLAEPEDFLTLINSEQKLPCHSAVDYEKDDWKDQVDKDSVPHCAGALIATRKMCKIPRDHELAKLSADIADDPIHINPFKFAEYHRGGSFKSWE